MIFTKNTKDKNLISKVIRFDMRRQQWIAANEAPGTIPKPFWYFKSKQQCLARIGTDNDQQW